MAYDNQKIYLDNREKKCRLVENNISKYLFNVLGSEMKMNSLP